MLLLYRDTAGQEEYDAITEQYFRRAQGVLLAYDITNQKSFDHLQIWIKKLKEVWFVAKVMLFAVWQHTIEGWW